MNPPKLYLKSHVYINYTRDVERGAPLINLYLDSITQYELKRNYKLVMKL